MTTKLVRKIVHIDEAKCDGCGACAIACAEGALKIIDGKARLISENYCDGLGACLGECPQGAIIIEERAAEEFSEEAVKHHLHKAEEKIPCGCPGASLPQFSRQETAATPSRGSAQSRLGHWPVQLTLVPPFAPFLHNADIVLSADCVPFAYPRFHEDFLAGHALLIGCPKLDDVEAYLEKLTRILEMAQPKSLTVVHMEVPCCSGLVYIARQAMQASGVKIPFREVTIGVKGDIEAEAG